MKHMHITRKTFLVAGLVVVLLGGSVFAYTQLRPERKGQAEQEDVNFDPPTEQEQQAGDEQKEEIVDEEENPAPPPTQASVVIADASQYGDQIEVRAFVTNIIKAGTCTFTFTKGSTSLQKQTTAFEDASTTQCTALTVPRGEFPSAGTWTATVKYDGPNITGQAQQNFEVQ